jgi:hypothetical protein
VSYGDPRSARAPTRIAIPLLALFATIASGCLKADIQLTLAPDGTADGTVILAYTRALIASNEMSDAEARDALQQELEDENGPAFDCEPWDDTTYLGVECTFEGATLEELNEEDVMGHQLTFEQEEDSISVAGDVDLQGIDPANEVFDDFDAQLQIDCPGQIQEQTDGEEDNRTVTWQLEAGETIQVAATSAIGGSIPWLLVGVGAGLLIVIIGVVAIVLLRRRSGSTQASPPPAAPSAPTTPTPPAAGT